jgi:hypothetical protein
LLATYAARDEAELAALTSTSLPALRAYLAGRDAYRRGRVREAAEQYFERAAFLDSGFALAVLGLAAVEELEGPGRIWAVDAIWRRRDQLSQADRALLAAHLGPHYPRPATLAERIAAGVEATRVAPHRVEAWYIAGENLRRYGSLVGRARWEAEAVAAFERALALDSTDAQTLDRLLLLAAHAGDRKAVRRYADLSSIHNPHAESADFLRWRAAVALDDAASLAAVRRQFSDMSDISLQRIVMWSHEHGAGVEDGDRAAAALLRRASATNQRRVALTRMVRVLLNRGRPSEAKRLLAESELDFGPQQGVRIRDFPIYAALYWDGDTSDAIAAARRLDVFLDGTLRRSADMQDTRTAACALAHWRLAAGEFGAAEEVLARLRRLDAAADSLASPGTRVCLIAVQAQLRAARSDPSGTSALEQLDSLLRAASSSRDLFYNIGNLVAVRLYEARGDFQHALAAARRRAGWNAFLSTQLHEEARLAALNGDRAGAIRAYRHYLALRSNPQPHLRPQAERVRAELEWLERGGEPVAGRPVVRR